MWLTQPYCMQEQAAKKRLKLQGGINSLQDLIDLTIRIKLASAVRCSIIKLRFPEPTETNVKT